MCREWGADIQLIEERRYILICNVDGDIGFVVSLEKKDGTKLLY